MRVPVATCAGAIALLAVPAAASAEKTIDAQTVWRFDASQYMLQTGEKVTFKNDDAASPGPHNVTSTQKGPDGKPLFASETIKNGEQSTVAGAQQLPAGSYDFICTVHPFMMAKLVVAGPAAGAPPGAAPAPADTTKPAVRPALARTSLRRALRARQVVALVTSDESVTLRLSLVARVHGRSVTIGRAAASDDAPGKAFRVAVKLGPSGRKALRGLRQAALTLYVEARDQAGNLTTTKASRTATA